MMPTSLMEALLDNVGSQKDQHEDVEVTTKRKVRNRVSNQDGDIWSLEEDFAD